MKKHLVFSMLALSSVFFILSCAKGPGEGGKASITGKVYAHDYSNVRDSDFSTPPFPLCNCYLYEESYYSPGENVSIIYGDEPGVGKQVKTSYDGTYVFDFLRPGKYKIIAYSRDTTSASNSQTIEVVKEVEITGKKSNTVVDDLVIIK